MFKQILVPVAAFAVTVTGASAFGGDGYMLQKLDMLSEKEQAAFEEAREVRDTSRVQAHEVLENAGINDERMAEIHDAMRVTRDANQTAMDQMLKDGDYEAFLEAVEGTPMENVVTSKSDFEKFVEAHELRQAGDFEEAQEIMEDLGLEPPQGGRGFGKGGHMMGDGNGFGGPGRGEQRSGWQSAGIE